MGNSQKTQIQKHNFFFILHDADGWLLYASLSNSQELLTERCPGAKKEIEKDTLSDLCRIQREGSCYTREHL